MVKKTRTFWLGAFLVGGTIIAMATLIWLGAWNWFQATDLYATYFDTSVQGLNPDADVKFRGVKVGRVKEIRLAPDGELVEVVMSLEAGVRVSESLRAKVELAGITGMKYVALDKVDGEKLLMHPDLNFTSRYPVIPSYPGGFEEIGQALKDIYSKIIEIDTGGISVRLKKLLDSAAVSADYANRLLRDPDFTGWARSVNRTAQEVDAAVRQLDFAAYDAEIRRTLAEFRQGAENFNQFTFALGRQASGMDLDSLARNLNTMVTTTSDVLARLNYQSNQILVGVNHTMESLTQVIYQLNELMEVLESYPSNFLYTAPPPKEK